MSVSAESFTAARDNRLRPLRCVLEIPMADFQHLLTRNQAFKISLANSEFCPFEKFASTNWVTANGRSTFNFSLLIPS